MVSIYIYGRGRRFPERTSIRIIELEKKQCFTVVKWRFFMSFFYTPPLHASYMNVITPHPTPSRKLHERFYTPPLHASYMNVITPHPIPPHPFTQVTWTFLHPTSSRKLHERYYTPPHRSPPLPPAWLMHDKYKRTYTSVAWRMRDKYKITYTSVAWRRRHNYKRTYTSVTWHMPEKYITWL